MKGTQQYLYYVQDDEHGTQHAVCGPSFNNVDCSHFSTVCYRDEKKSTRTSRIYFVVSVRSSVGVVADHLIAVTPALLAFLALIKMTSCSCLLTQRLPGQQLSLRKLEKVANKVRNVNDFYRLIWIPSFSFTLIICFFYNLLVHSISMLHIWQHVQKKKSFYYGF